MLDGYPTGMEVKSQFFLTDTHAHLASTRFSGDFEGVLTRAREAGVGRIVSISCDREDSETNLTLAAASSEIFATVGVHPLYVHETGSGNWLGELAALAVAPEVVAIGEIGLDYYHPPQDGSAVGDWRRRQREVFEALLQVALDRDLPAVIHQRECADEVDAVLANFPGVRAVLHCFTGTRAEAERALGRGLHLSFTGVVTYKNANELRETVAALPLDRIMVETDAPYLAPVPFRGKTCEPAMVAETARQIGELHGLNFAEISRITSETAEKFFRFEGATLSP